MRVACPHDKQTTRAARTFTRPADPNTAARVRGSEDDRTENTSNGRRAVCGQKQKKEEDTNPYTTGMEFTIVARMELIIVAMEL